MQGALDQNSEVTAQLSAMWGDAGEASSVSFMDGFDWTQMQESGIQQFEQLAPDLGAIGANAGTGGMAEAGSEAGQAYGAAYAESIQTALAAVNQGMQMPVAGPEPDSLASTEGLNAQAPTVDTSEITESVTAMAESMVAFGTDAGTNLSTGVEGSIAGLPGTLQSSGQTGMQQFNSAISAGAAVATATIRGMVQTMQAAVNGLGSGMYNAGQMAMQGLTNGLAAGGAAAVAKAQEIAAQVKNAISGAQGFQNGSPSKYFTESGGFAMQGLANGLAAKGVSAVSAAGDVAGGIKAEMTDLSPTARLSPLSAGASGGGPVTVTYAPIFNISGASQNDVVQAQRISQREFERMMKEYQRGVGRVAFG
jgi:hypothetical protein